MVPLLWVISFSLFSKPFSVWFLIRFCRIAVHFSSVLVRKFYLRAKVASEDLFWVSYIYLWSCHFCGIHDCPSNKIFQSFENRNRHVHYAKITYGNCNMFHCHLCSGYAFNLITFYLVLTYFSNNSETIRTKEVTIFPGENGCILGCLKRFLCLRMTNKAEFKVFILLLVEISRFISSHLHYSYLISMENSDVKLTHDCHHIHHEASECRSSLKYFSTFQSCTFKLELTFNELFCLKFCLS